jgi:hypothetical protein
MYCSWRLCDAQRPGGATVHASRPDLVLALVFDFRRSAHFVFVKKFFSLEKLKFHARGLRFRARIFKFSISTNTEKAMAK